MFWNQRFEYHMGMRLSRDHGISTLHEEGKMILALARRYKAAAKAHGFPAQFSAIESIDEAVRAWKVAQ